MPRRRAGLPRTQNVIYIPHSEQEMWNFVKQELEKKGIPLNRYILSLVRKDLPRILSEADFDLPEEKEHDD